MIVMSPILFSEAVITVIMKFTYTRTSLPVTSDSDRLGTIIYIVTVENFATLEGKAYSFTLQWKPERLSICTVHCRSDAHS
jgi:hypothetical protein